jgi:hypothetical protein
MVDGDATDHEAPALDAGPVQLRRHGEIHPSRH